MLKIPLVVIGAFAVLWFTDTIQAEELPQLACTHISIPDVSGVSVCNSFFEPSETVVMPNSDDACLLEQLWREGKKVDGQTFRLNRPVVLKSTRHPVIKNSSFDFSSVDDSNSDALIIFADDSSGNGSMISDVFLSPISGRPFSVLEWLPRASQDECNPLTS